MKYLLGEILDDFVGQLVVLLFSHEANELRERLGQVVLRVKERNDLVRVLSEHVAHLGAELLHALLHHVEQQLLHFFVFDVVLVFEQIKSGLDEQIDEGFVDLVLGPEVVHVELDDADEQFYAFFVRHQNRIVVHLVCWLLRVFLFAFRQVEVSGVFELRVLAHEPCDQVNVSLEHVLEHDDDFELRILHAVGVLEHVRRQQVLLRMVPQLSHVHVVLRTLEPDLKQLN